MTGDTFTAPSNAVLVIENGQLDTNGYKLQTTSGSGLTIVFTAPTIQKLIIYLAKFQ
ncbi:MAG: hypothetical protein ACR2KT_06505 [Methylocella sp.]